jgi:hypothetical protein
VADILDNVSQKVSVKRLFFFQKYNRTDTQKIHTKEKEKNTPNRVSGPSAAELNAPSFYNWQSN